MTLVASQEREGQENIHHQMIFQLPHLFKIEFFGEQKVCILQ